MSIKSELDKKISDAWSLHARYTAIYNDCEQKLDRLRPVYKTLGKIKDDFKTARRNTKEVFAEKGAWHGEKYTAFCSDGDKVDSECEAYYQLLDQAQDTVNVKIGELEAKKLEIIPLLGRVLGRIRQWEREIQNIGN